MNRTKCLIWGGYGMGNVGDELTLAVAICDVRKRFGDEFAILSPVPGYTRALFPSERVFGFRPVRSETLTKVGAFIKKFRGGADSYPVHRQLAMTESRTWVEAIRHAELLYLAGGGYLTDLFDLELTLLPVRLAHSHGVRVETAPQGIGPFRTRESQDRFRSAFQEVRLTVRDSESMRLCEKIPIPTVLQPDDGFRVAEVVEGLDQAPRRDRIGVNIFSQYGDPDPLRSLDWWRALLTLLKRQGTSLEGFCFHNQIRSDFAQTSECFAEAGIPLTVMRPPDFDFRDACRYVAGLRAVVTSRFHAAVVANACGIPAIAVASGDYYGAKMAAACAGSSTSRVVFPAHSDPTEVAALIDALN